MKKKVLNKLLIVFGILIIISVVHADAADIKLSPSSGNGFQGSESSDIGDHTSYIRNLDGTWGPPTSADVPFDYYATGLDSRFWDALSLRFNTGTYSPSDYKAVLRFYAQRGGYGNNQWNHYILLQGDRNPTYQDADWEAVANDPNIKSLGGSAGSWFEVELPDSYWNSGSTWVTLRMWNVRVDAVELSLISKVTPSITVTSPNGGETWVHGSTHDITWTSSGDAGSNVKIELLKGGSVYRTLANTLNDGSCSWTLLDTEGTGSDYRVRITSSTNAAITDVSNGYFSITAPNPPSSITVTSPNGGETWVHGSTHDITWTSSGDAGSNVKIELLKGGSVYRTLANTLNDGSCSWTLLDAEGTGSDYRVRITSSTNSAINDVSNGYFSITAPNPPSSITVTSPNGGEIWQRGKTHTITWDYTGNPGPYVKITLLQRGNEVETISASTSTGSNGKGSCTWSIPPTGSGGSNMQVKIQSISQPSVVGTTSSFFLVSATQIPSITIMSPNGGESLVQGSTKTIGWSSSGEIGSYVTIELLKGSSLVQTLSASTLSNPENWIFRWTIPTTLAPGSDYRIRITSTTNPSISDVSDSYFTITSAATGSITVVEPNSNTYWWWWGNSYPIRWTYTGNPGSTVNILLFKGTTQVTTIATVPIGSGGTGYYEWTVPHGIGEGVDFSVHIQSTSQPSISNSGGNFPIYHQWRDDAIAFDYQNINSPSREMGTNVRILTSTPSTYYATFSWTGQGTGIVGYYGIQSDGGTPSQRHVHFTVWDYDAAKPTQVIFKDSDVVCKSDRSEGPAQICTWNYNWIQDHDYKLVIKAENVGETTQYQALFYPDETSLPKHIATLAYQKKDTWINQISSFIEDFEYYPQHCGSLYYRSVLLGKGYRIDLSNTAFPLNSAMYSPNGECGNRNANVQYINNIGYFFAETGSGVIERISRGSILNIITPQNGRITVTSPNGGETLLKGSVHQITWTSAGTIGRNVKIELLKGNSVVGTISNTANVGSYSWTVLSSYATGTDYKIRITSLTYPEISDTSDNSFIIADRVPPIADFSGFPVSGTAPLSVAFTDHSTGTAITNWRWDFGDGTITNYGSKTNPTHRYSTAGTYSVALTVTNAYGSHTRTRTGYITVTSVPVIPGSTHIGLFRPANGYWYLETTRTGAVASTFQFGKSGDIPLVGDWDGNGVTDAGVFRPANGYWYLDTTKTGAVNTMFHFGKTGDIPLAGDWDGNGISDAGVFRPANGYWYLDTTKTGAVNMMFHLGKTGDIPLVGDWDGDRITDTGVFRPANGYWYLDTTKTGEVNTMFHLGKTGDIPLVGDWDGNGISDTGVFRPANGYWYLDTTKTGAVNTMFHLGKTGDIPLVGDWDGNGISDTGVFRPANGYWYLDTTKTGAVNTMFHFGRYGDSPQIGTWI